MEPEKRVIVNIVMINNSKSNTIAGRSPSASQLLAFSPGKEQAAGVWET